MKDNISDVYDMSDEKEFLKYLKDTSLLNLALTKSDIKWIKYHLKKAKKKK